jgi:multiple sugar transport system permease protein
MRNETKPSRRRVPWRPAAALLVALLALFPLIWMISTSLRDPGQPLTRRLQLVPDPIAWGNYPEVFGLIDLWRFAANSAFVVTIAVPLTVVVASWAGFAMSQLSPAWRVRLILLSFAVEIVPQTAIWVPRFVLFKQVGLVDTPWALIAPALMGTSPFFTLFFLWAFLRIPREIFEAARLDGAGPLRAWATIGMPLARPTATAVAMLAFIYFWSNYVDPLLFIQTTEKQTLPFALRMLYQLASSDWPLLLAAATMVTAPAVLVFLLGQRYFLGDLGRSARWRAPRPT